MFRIIRSWWRSRQRRLDLAILWPICKQHARNLNCARVAFAIHAFNDPAWVGEYEEWQLIDIIGELE